MQPVSKIKALLRHRGMTIAYRDAFSTPAGKQVLRDLMSRFHVASTTFTLEGSETYIREGQRMVVLHIMEMLRIADNPVDINQEIENAKRDYALTDASTNAY